MHLVLSHVREGDLVLIVSPVHGLEISAIDDSMEALGLVETARFLTLPRQEQLDSVIRHRRWQDDLQKDLFFDQLFGDQALSGSDGPAPLPHRDGVGGGGKGVIAQAGGARPDARRTP